MIMISVVDMPFISITIAIVVVIKACLEHCLWYYH